jgi:type IV secretion system protein TrbJ
MRFQRLTLLAIVATWLVAAHAFAVLGIGDIAIVEDPQNLVENSLTAANTMEALVKLQNQLRQQLVQIQQDAQHLMALPVSYVQQIQGIMGQYNQALAMARGMSYQASALRGQWQALYGAVSTGSLPQKAQALMSAMQTASGDAAQMQAIYGQLTTQAQQVQALLAASQVAPGSRATQQATNQLLGVLAEQQQMLAQVEASGWRVQTMALMNDEQANEQARQSAQRWMQGFGEVRPVAVGEGQGPALPQ